MGRLGNFWAQDVRISTVAISWAIMGILAVSGTVHAQSDVQHRVMHIDDVDYPLAIYIPEAPNPSPLPVMILLHGHGGTGDRALNRLGIKDLAAEKRFIVLAPSARETRWRDFGDADQQADFDLFEKLLDLAPTLGGDPKRVYIVGFSNGGNMSMVIGGKFADRIAAIGSGGSTIGRMDQNYVYAEIPKPKQRIPILLFHGMLDDVIGYDHRTNSVPTPDCLTWWAKQDGITSVAKHEALANGDILRDTFESSDGLRASLLSYRKLGHDWPNIIDNDTGTKFNDMLWEFLSRYTLK